MINIVLILCLGAVEERDRAGRHQDKSRALAVPLI